MNDFLEQINSIIDWVSKFGTHLMGLSGFTLTMCFCWMGGFFLKKTEWIPKNRIPTVLIFSGMFLGVMLADTMTPPMYFRLWLAKNAIVGGLAGGTAWFLHHYRKAIILLVLYAISKLPMGKKLAEKLSKNSWNSDPELVKKKK